MGNTVPTASIPQGTQDPKTFLQTEPELSKFIIVVGRITPRLLTLALMPRVVDIYTPSMT
jgi:hypothetical protein